MKKTLLLLLFLFLKFEVKAAVVVSENLKEDFPYDYLLNEELIISELTTIGAPNKNVFIKDVCKVNDDYYLVGGSVNLGNFLGEMDAFILKYNKKIIWFKTFGGSGYDIFNSVDCANGIVAVGETKSIDGEAFGKKSKNFKSGLIVSVDQFGEKNYAHLINKKLDLILTSVGYHDYHYISGYSEKINDYDIVVFKFANGQLVKETSYNYSGNDKVEDIYVGEEILMVGSTTSKELGAISKNGILIKINEQLSWLDAEIYNKNYSQFNKIAKGENYQIFGSLKYNDQSTRQGLYVEYQDEFNSVVVENVEKLIGKNSSGYYGNKEGHFYINNEEYAGEIVEIIDDFIFYNKRDVVSNGYIEKRDFLKYDQQLLFNDTEVPLTKKYLNDSYDATIFGDYDYYLYGIQDNYQFYLDKKTEKVNYFSNIENRDYYDKLVIFFNGKGYLNGKSIESAYILKTPGKYKLELVGLNETVIKEFYLKAGSKKIAFYQHLSAND